MGYPVTAVLERRLAETARVARLGRCLAVALTAHLLFAAAALWLPSLRRSAKLPVQYVAIQIVPAAKLGVERPRPPEAQKAPVKAPEPTPKAPVLPDPKKTKPVAAPEPAKSRSEPAPAKPEPAPAQPEAEGSPLGAAAGLALGAAIAGLENPDFTYGYYVDQMLGLLQRNWVRPLIGSGVEATVYYRIQRDGRITDLAIAKSSGINSFDLAALRAVQSSSPLPPLPRAYRHSYLGVTLVFR